MFTSLRRRVVASWIGLAVGLVLCGVAACSDPVQVRRPVRSAESIAELAERLRSLHLRMVPLPGNSDPERGAFLTTTRKSPEELASAAWGDETRENLRQWRGSLRIRHLTNWYGEEDEEVQPPGAAVWRWGRFLIFGDVELLKKVRRTLADG